MPGPRYANELYYLAEENEGLFLAAEARERLAIPTPALVNMERRGILERVARGVYRLTAYPPSAFSQYREALLALRVNRPDVHAVVSHESALSLHGLSDVNPSKVHVTLPSRLRLRREAAAFIRIHQADLAEHDVTTVEGIPTTSVARTIRDCASLGPSITRDAIDDAIRLGKLSKATAAKLEHALL